MKRLTSARIPAAVGPYSAATQVGNLILTSGQLPINPDTGKIDYADCIKWQTEQSLKNIQSILEDNGSSMSKVVKITVYLANISDFAAFNDVYGSFFEGGYPSRTAFEVANLPMGALVEIEAIAKGE